MTETWEKDLNKNKYIITEGRIIDEIGQTRGLNNIVSEIVD